MGNIITERFNFYGVPYGVIRSSIKHMRISFSELSGFKCGEIVERVIECQYGAFYFRRGGKNGSWLCYKWFKD